VKRDVPATCTVSRDAKWLLSQEIISVGGDNRRNVARGWINFAQRTYARRTTNKVSGAVGDDIPQLRVRSGRVRLTARVSSAESMQQRNSERLTGGTGPLTDYCQQQRYESSSEVISSSLTYVTIFHRTCRVFRTEKYATFWLHASSQTACCVKLEVRTCFL